VEAPADQRLDSRERPSLVLPAVGSWPLGQLRLQLRELLLAQSRERRRPLRSQSPWTSLVPHPPPPLHRADTDPQALGDHRTRLTPGELLRCFEPQILTTLLPFGGQPAPLWIPHARVIPHGRGAVIPYDTTSSTSVTGQDGAVRSGVSYGRRCQREACPRAPPDDKPLDPVNPVESV
jgi:hypothetical protein